MSQPCKRGLRTLHRIPAVKLLGVIVLDVLVPVRSTVRRVTGAPSKALSKAPRTRMWIVPPVGPVPDGDPQDQLAAS